MKTKLLSFLLALVLVMSALPLAVSAEDLYLNPPDDWWGMSKTAFTNTYKDDKFTELEIDGLKALVLTPMVETDDLTLDVYFRFAEKPAGKSYYGISEVTYLVPLEGSRYTDAQLKTLFNKVRTILVHQNGRASKRESTQAVWNLEDFTITLAIKAYRKYNRSTNKTVGVTYVKTLAASDSGNSSTGSAKSSAALTVTAAATCSDYNHVGEKWTQVFYVNGSRVKEGKTVELKVGDTVRVSATITEGDSQPDSATATTTHDTVSASGWMSEVTASRKSVTPMMTMSTPTASEPRYSMRP